MQQGGSQYGVSPEMAPFAAAAAPAATATTTAAATSTRTLVLGGVAAAATDHHHHHQLKLGDPALAVAEEASPISSRPPAHSSALNFDELLPVGGGGLPDEDALAAAADEGDRGGVAGGNRWPRQETLALLKIRSEMDVAFRDATLKGPLWEDVSRKLAELGYTRSAKKCKEKFENVHKYYKRTKEGRAGRQDGKSYRFFTQLEALHNTAPSNVSPAPATPLTTVNAPPTTNTTTATTVVSPPTNLIVAAPISIGIASSNPIPVSSVRIPSVNAAAMGASPMFPPDLSSGMISAPPGSAPPTVPAAAPTTHAALGISFSSNTSSSSSGTDDDEPEDEDIFQGEPSNADSSRFHRKRKRGSSGGSSNSRRMMDFFESLMKQVMEKQEVMQQRFLETIEKREQDRMIREEAWKRQEMARLSREHDLMAQERALSASRDAAIIAFLQKITGQTIQFPTPATIPAAPPPPAPAPVPPPAPPTQHHHHHQPQPQQQQPQPQQQQQQQHHHHHQHHHHQQQQQTHHIHHQQHQSQSTQVVVRHQPSISAEVVMAIPEQQVPPQEMSSGGGGGSLESSSSRWPKAEVLALIKLRSGLDSRYQEAGPKGPLWEEISAGMQQMGYKRSSKRCKEKWENINKYFKKVKESNKKRPEDAKTCPYFHQLDALYRQKLLGSTSASGGSGTSVSGSYINPNRPEEQQQPPPQLEGAKLDPIPTPFSQDRGEVPPAIMPPQVTTSQGAESESKNGASSDEQTNNGGLPGSLFGEGSSTPKKPEDIVKDQQVVMEDYDNGEELDSDNMDQEEEDDEEEDDDDEESEEERKIGYKIEFQRQNAGSSNGGGNGTTPSFLAVVQ